jgi:oxazoline/thiazoline dehydrogenase
MPHKLVLSLCKNITLVEEVSTQTATLFSPNCKITFHSIRSGIRKVLYSLTEEGADIENLHDFLEVDEGILTEPKLNRYLQKFSQLGWLCYSVFAENDLVAIAVPLCKNTQFAHTQIFTESRYLLSRFAYLHLVDGKIVLESPLSKMQIRLSGWQGIAIINQLAVPCTYLELASQIPHVSINTAKQFLCLLINTQMIAEVSIASNVLEQEDLSLDQWEFHDLLFHTCSRMGRHSKRVGGTYRFLEKIDPLPAIKPNMSDNIIKLFKPDLENLKNMDVSFTKVLEERKSIRKYGEHPITIQQLGEFLYRAARVKEIIQTQRGEIMSCPYPSAGSLYELELYPVINQCKNISSGIYHYCPLNHQLSLFSENMEILDTLIKTASQSLGEQDIPQVIIVITARFQRISWKYESIAYSLVLEHVGVLYQTMYLVATAMKLAPCGMGRGNSDLFSKIAGCNYYSETSVGEFALGSRQ